MSQGWPSWLERWKAAGLIDADTAARIEAFEASHAGTTRLRWPMLIAIAFGAIMVAGGVLLFVAANWDALSPASRFALVLALVSGFHLAGAFTATRFAQMSEALHAVGTVALGGGIALAGQIFNLQEHWPGGVMLWALGSGAGWLLLRDTSQMTLFAVFAPAWIISEWLAATDVGVMFWQARYTVPAAGTCLLALAYFAAPAGERPPTARRVLMWLGGIALVISAGVLADATRGRAPADESEWKALLPIGYGVALIAPLVVATLLRRANWLPQALATLWVALLCFAVPSMPDLVAYAWWIAGSLGLVAWGVNERRVERVNLGALIFAATILVFYFSEVMDKLGRSAALIGMGLLFLGGGWALERVRRKLAAKAREAP